MPPFSPEILILFVLLGAVGGFLAGLLGIGGGIIFIPLFLWLFPLAGFPAEHVAHIAFATSLAIIIPTSISSALGHRKRGNVDWHQVYRISLGGAAGAVVGAYIASLLPGESLKGIFGVMQILVGLKLFLQPRHLPPERTTPVPFSHLAFVGLCGGLFSAFFGVGGGVIAVPMLVILIQLPTRLAVGNSSALVVISSFFGAVSYILYGWDIPGLPPYSLGYVNLLIFLLMAPFAMLSARFGVRVASSVPHDKLLKIFSLLMIGIGVRMIVRVYF